jgi:hypothetical protein
MQGNGVRRRFAGLLFGLMLVLDACAEPRRVADDSELNVYPANYKAEILAAMHAYLNDPTGIRDAGLSEPMIKSVGSDNRYLVCVRFNGKRRGSEYAGVKDVGALFIAGRFDRFIESVREQCAGAAYAPFPELGKLTR